MQLEISQPYASLWFQEEAECVGSCVWVSPCARVCLCVDNGGSCVWVYGEKSSWLVGWESDTTEAFWAWDSTLTLVNPQTGKDLCCWGFAAVNEGPLNESWGYNSCQIPADGIRPQICWFCLLRHILGGGKAAGFVLAKIILYANLMFEKKCCKSSL